MLERIPQTKKVLDKADPRTRKMLDAAIAVQMPLVERIDAERFCEDYRMVAPRLEFPVSPSPSVVAFAAEVASAWDGLDMKDRKALGLPPVFLSQPNTLGYMFFGTRGNCSLRLGMIIHNAERARRELGIRTLLKRLVDGKLDFTQFKKSMQKFEITFDAPFDIKPRGDGLMYTARTQFCRVTAHVPDLSKALAESEKTELELRLDIARRLSVGYSPSL